MSPQEKSDGLVHVAEIMGGQVARRDFGGGELAQPAETAATALAAREKAAVEARFLMAIHRPRDYDTARIRLLKECSRKGFAETAEYERPVGKEKNEDTGKWEDKFVRGPSIRLLEAAVQNYGNIEATATVTFESPEFRMVQARMIDLETNASWSQDIIIPKRIEKRGFAKRDGSFEPPKGREVVSHRLNSYGDPTYLVVATDAEVTILQSALISKAQRKNGERLLPSDLINEALEKCRQTLAEEDSKDPAAAARKVMDAFAALNIMPKDLTDYLGKPLDRLQPVDLTELRRLCVAITNSEISWEDALLAKQGSREGSAEDQHKAAIEKLANLRKPKTSPQPSNAGGATVDGAGTTRPAGEGGMRGPEPPPSAASQGSEATPPPVPPHISELLDYRQKIGAEKWLAILGAYGIQLDRDADVIGVSLQQVGAMREDFDLAVRARESTQASSESGGVPHVSKAASRLRFGGMK